MNKEIKNKSLVIEADMSVYHFLFLIFKKFIETTEFETDRELKSN